MNKWCISFVALVLFTVEVCAMDIVPSHSGSWYNPSQDGHGISLEVLDDGIVLAYWYTFAPNGHSMFLVGIGSKNGSKAVLDTYAYEGMKFGEFDPAGMESYEWGTMTVDFHNCNQMTFSYNSTMIYDGTPFGSDSMPMVRLSAMDNMKCSESPATGNYILTYTLEQEATIGTGMTIVFPDGYFAGFSASAVGGYIFLGNYAVNGNRMTINLSEYNIFGGVENVSATGDLSEGTFQFNAPNGLLVGVRAHELTQKPPGIFGATVNIEDALNGMNGSLTINLNGDITGNMYGCTVSGSANAPDKNFDQTYVGLRLTGCSMSGAYEGGILGDVFLLADGFTGYMWIVK
jgi:hypothetical protein